MDNAKQVRIVGKGHASCFERLLEEWYRSESFADVVLWCSDGEPEPRPDSDLSGTCRSVAANRSVLAAASPVFARIFSDSVGEDVLNVTMVGYSFTALKAVVECIYTGCLQFLSEDRVSVEDLLREFGIMTAVISENVTFQPKTASVVSDSANCKEQEVTDVNSKPKSTTTPRKIVDHVILHASGTKSYHVTLNRDSSDSPVTDVVTLAQSAITKRSTPLMTSRSVTNHHGRKVKRNIDAAVLRPQDLVMSPPTLHHGALVKSSVEKSVVHSDAVFPIPDKNRTLAAAGVEPVVLRRIVATLFDVPGIFTHYRERNPAVVELSYCTAPKKGMDESHYYIPSYMMKSPSRTYARRQDANCRKRTAIASVKIDSIHQVRNKVHVRTIGTPVVSKESETLYEDSPMSFLSPDQVASRVHLEHNYSFGEPVTSEHQQECTSNTELADDLEDYKQAIQLAINEQRKKIRLNQRLHNMEKEAAALKTRAKSLLNFCRSKSDAHQTDDTDAADADHLSRADGKRNPHTKTSPGSEVRVPCDVCNKMVKKSWLKRHKLALHSHDRPHLCEECGRTFVMQAQLRTHQLRQHSKISTSHLCNVCGKSFRFAQYLRRHMTLHLGEKPFQCRFCDKTFRLQPVLVKHIRTHTGEKPYKCTVCGKCFTQRTTYARHSKLHEKWKEMGLAHTEGNGETRPVRRLKCDFCSMTFRLDLFLMLHRAKHTGETPALPCPTCTETFPSIHELSQHRKDRHPETVYSCHLCSKVFTNKANFDFHVHKHSNPNAVKKKYPKINIDTGPCTCEFCGKEVKSRTALDYHIKDVHLGEKPLKCTYCYKTFSHRPTLEQHIRTHTGERPFKCLQCPSAFKQNQHLTAHMVVHTGERPFACTFCPKDFPHKTTLYAHLRMHTGKRLMCSHCRRVLPSVTQLQRHEDQCQLRPNPPAIEESPSTLAS